MFCWFFLPAQINEEIKETKIFVLTEYKSILWDKCWDNSIPFTSVHLNSAYSQQKLSQGTFQSKGNNLQKYIETQQIPL